MSGKELGDMAAMFADCLLISSFIVIVLLVFVVALLLYAQSKEK